MIDFQKYNVEFDESDDNGEFLTTTFYFTASKDILAKFMPPEDYAEAILAEISVEMSNQFPEPAFCACNISPTREVDGGLEDYDWHNIALTDEEINNLLKLAGEVNNMSTYILVESCDADIGIYKYSSEEAAKESLFSSYATILRRHVDDEKVEHALSLLRDGDCATIEENWQPCGMLTGGAPTFTAYLSPDHGSAYDSDNGVLIAWRLEPLDALTE